MEAPLAKLDVSDRFSEDQVVILRAVTVHRNGCTESVKQIDKSLSDSNKIVLKNMVERNGTFCTQALQVEPVFFNLSEYPEGRYEIFDGYDLVKAGELVIDDQGNHKFIPIDELQR